jgi:hypothetical protein
LASRFLNLAKLKLTSRAATSRPERQSTNAPLQARLEAEGSGVGVWRQARRNNARAALIWRSIIDIVASLR